MKLYRNFQYQLKELILCYMQKFANSTDDGSNDCLNAILQYLEDLKNSLNIIKENISILDSSLDYINHIISDITKNNDMIDIKKFDLFKIVFEVAPVVVNKNSATSVELFYFFVSLLSIFFTFFYLLLNFFLHTLIFLFY